MLRIHLDWLAIVYRVSTHQFRTATVLVQSFKVTVTVTLSVSHRCYVGTFLWIADRTGHRMFTNNTLLFSTLLDTIVSKQTLLVCVLRLSLDPVKQFTRFPTGPAYPTATK